MLGAARLLTPLILAFSLSLAVAQGQPLDPLKNTLAEIEQQAGAAKKSIESEKDNPKALSTARLGLQASRVQLVALRKEIQTALQEAKTDLEVLGETSDKGTESETIQNLRSSLNEKISELQGLSLRAIAAEQLIADVQSAAGQQLRGHFVESVFARSPVLFTENTLALASEGFASQAGNAQTYLSDWWRQQTKERTLTRSLVLGFGALVAFWILTVPLRSFIGDRVWRRFTPLEISAPRRSAIALTRASTRIVLAAIAIFVIHQTSMVTGLISEDTAHLSVSVAQAFLVVFIAHAISRAILAPERSVWRLVPLSDPDAGLAHKWIVTAASLFAADQIFKAIWQSNENYVSLISLQTLMVALLLSAMSVWAYRAYKNAPTATHIAGEGNENFNWPLIITVCLSVTTITASMFSYAPLARYIIEKSIFLSLLAGYLFLFRSFFQSWILLAVERLIFGSVRTAPDPNDVVAFWTRLSVDFLLLIFAAPVALYILGVDWPEIGGLALLAVSDFSIGALQISPINFLYALLLFSLLLLLTRFIQRLLEKSILPNTRLNPGVRHSLKALIGYAGLIIAAFAAISTLGFDLSSLALIAGALSVGIGFGLQSIVNNFVSGLILLFERPSKLGIGS